MSSSKRKQSIQESTGERKKQKILNMPPYAPNTTEPCREASCRYYGRKTSRHFYIDNTYCFSLCTQCRGGTGDDHEVNLTYMKKACAHFQLLWRAVLKKECIKLTKEQNIPKVHSKDDFFRPVARYENYFDLDAIKNHIKDVWGEKINPLFETYPGLIKYDPVETFVQCVDYALSKKKLKSKYIKNYLKKQGQNSYRYYWKDFDFSTYSGNALFHKKEKFYESREPLFAPLQALFRGYIVRKRVMDQLRMKSAVEIQASWRKKRAMLLLKKQKECTVKIQAAWRGCFVRQPYGVRFSMMIVRKILANLGK